MELTLYTNLHTLIAWSASANLGVRLALEHGTPHASCHGHRFRM